MGTCKPIQIFRGDDSDAFELRTLTINITGALSLDDATATFSLLNYTKSFTNEETKTGHLTMAFAAADTKQMPIGPAFGTLQLFEGGKRLTVVNTIPFFISNLVFGAPSQQYDVNVELSGSTEVNIEFRIEGSGGGGGTDANAVHYSVDTGKSVGQKAVARTNIGLGNVDNTSDLNKPISTATQAALNGKQATITDLATIRSGAALGATSLQPSSNLDADKLASGTVPAARLPVAGDNLGAVKADTKTAEQTVPVGVDSDGKLYVAPSGGEPDEYIKDASVANNTLTLTKKDDTTVPVTAASLNAQTALSPDQLAATNSGITSGKVSTYDGYATQIDGKVSVSGDEMTGALTFKRLTVDGAKIDVGTGNTWPSLYLRGRTGSAKYFSNMIVINDTIQVGLPSSSGDLAITDDIPEVVAPSTSSTDAGKAADAKVTGIALAAKVSSFAAVGGQTPTVVNGVADLSTLFSSDNTSLASTIQTKIDATVGTINTALDAINGEVA